MNKTVLFIVGFLVVIVGVALVLRYWDDTVIVFRGTVPAAIAVLGLVLMFAASLKK